MNIKISKSENFQLLKTVCRDHLFQATKSAVKKVINQAISHPGSYAGLVIRQYKKPIEIYYVRNTEISTVYKNGTLRLGCHLFNFNNSKKILKWAGVKTPKVAG